MRDCTIAWDVIYLVLISVCFHLFSLRIKITSANNPLPKNKVRNWEFLKPAPIASSTGELGGEINPLTLLKRRSSLVVADLPVLSTHSAVSSPVLEKAMSAMSLQQQQVPAEMKPGHGFGHGGGGGTPSTPHTNMKPKPPPTVFEEPDANSLLDSFGF